MFTFNPYNTNERRVFAVPHLMGLDQDFNALYDQLMHLERTTTQSHQTQSTQIEALSRKVDFLMTKQTEQTALIANLQNQNEALQRRITVLEMFTPEWKTEIDAWVAKLNAPAPKAAAKPDLAKAFKDLETKFATLERRLNSPPSTEAGSATPRNDDELLAHFAKTAKPKEPSLTKEQKKRQETLQKFMQQNGGPGALVCIEYDENGKETSLQSGQCREIFTAYLASPTPLKGCYRIFHSTVIQQFALHQSMYGGGPTDERPDILKQGTLITAEDLERYRKSSAKKA